MLTLCEPVHTCTCVRLASMKIWSSRVDGCADTRDDAPYDHTRCSLVMLMLFTTTLPH